MPPQFTVLLVPSDHLNWVGLHATLKAWREVRVRDVRRAAEAVAIAASEPHPALILVAADLPDPPVVSLVGTLQRASPASKMLIIGEPRDPAEHEALRCLGSARAYIEWADLCPESVQPVLTTILRSNLLIGSAGALERLLAAPERRRLRRDTSIALIPQERVVLQRLGAGLTQREIAHALYVSEATVERTIAALRGKFGVSTTCALCMQAGRLGFFD